MKKNIQVGLCSLVLAALTVTPVFASAADVIPETDNAKKEIVDVLPEDKDATIELILNVTDADNIPIKNTVVLINSLESEYDTSTDISGISEVALPEGLVRMNISKEGYKSQEMDLLINKETEVQNIVLEEAEVATTPALSDQENITKAVQTEENSIIEKSDKIDLLINESKPTRLKGDANNDGILDFADFELLKYALLDMGTLSPDVDVDMNNDGVISTSDLIMLRNTILGLC